MQLKYWGGAFLLAGLLVGCSAGTGVSSDSGAQQISVTKTAIQSLKTNPNNSDLKVVSARLIPNPYVKDVALKWPSQVWEINFSGKFPTPTVGCILSKSTGTKCPKPLVFTSATVFINPQTKKVLEISEPAVH